MIYNLYCLKHPITEEIIYIGCTTANLKDRLSQHIWDAKNKKSKKSILIFSIMEETGLKPVIALLEKCDESNWQEKEMLFISGYSNLSNTKKGGAGIILNRLSESISRSSKSKNKKIYQFDIKGNFIAEWGSIKEAAQSLGIVISAIGNFLHKRCKTAGGFLWCFEEDYLNNNLPILIPRKPRSKKISIIIE